MSGLFGSATASTSPLLLTPSASERQMYSVCGFLVSVFLMIVTPLILVP